MNSSIAMKLVLEDGTEMSGRAFGAARPVGGEVVFNTGMSGYVETLTDPSYRGQILVLTYPLVGNYGVPAPRAPGSLDGPYESDRIQVQGLVVQTYVDAYSHHAATRSLGAWLQAEGIPAITGIDTRTLTRRCASTARCGAGSSPPNDDARARQEGGDDGRDEGGLPPRRPGQSRPLSRAARSRSSSSTPAPRTTSSARCSSAGRP